MRAIRRRQNRRAVSVRRADQVRTNPDRMKKNETPLEPPANITVAGIRTGPGKYPKFLRCSPNTISAAIHRMPVREGNPGPAAGAGRTGVGDIVGTVVIAPFAADAADISATAPPSPGSVWYPRTGPVVEPRPRSGALQRRGCRTDVTGDAALWWHARTGGRGSEGAGRPHRRRAAGSGHRRGRRLR